MLMMQHITFRRGFMKKGLFSPVVRAIGVFSAVAVLVGGVTYAALQNQVTLTENTVSGADSNLQIWNTAKEGGADWDDTAPGFAVDGLVPGEWSEENFFYFYNAGETDVDISAIVNDLAPTPPVEAGFDSWEDLKVKFKNHTNDPSCAEEDKEVETDMAALIAGDLDLPCNPLAAGAMGNNQPGHEHTAGNYAVSYMLPSHEVVEGATDIEVGPFTYTFTGSVTLED
jgi:hypothetical protein